MCVSKKRLNFNDIFNSIFFNQNCSDTLPICILLSPFLLRLKSATSGLVLLATSLHQRVTFANDVANDDVLLQKPLQYPTSTFFGIQCSFLISISIMLYSHLSPLLVEQSLLWAVSRRTLFLLTFTQILSFACPNFFWSQMSTYFWESCINLVISNDGCNQNS